MFTEESYGNFLTFLKDHIKCGTENEKLHIYVYIIIYQMINASGKTLMISVGNLWRTSNYFLIHYGTQGYSVRIFGSFYVSYVDVTWF